MSVTLASSPSSEDRGGVATARVLARGQRGAALVEFTLVLPLLLLILLGILDFGKAINYWMDENQLAGVAARYAAVNQTPGGGGSLCDQVVAQADTEQLRTGASVSVTPGGSDIGDPIEARVEYPYTWLPLLGIGDVTLTGTATMRIENTEPDGPPSC